MNTNFLNSVTNFLKKRTFEFIGLILISMSIGLAIAFTTYSPEDPSFVYGDREFEIKNFFGIYGSSIADFLLQSFGLVSFLILANFLFWGVNLIIQKEIKRIVLKLFLVVSYLVFGTIFIYFTKPQEKTGQGTHYSSVGDSGCRRSNSSYSRFAPFCRSLPI